LGTRIADQDARATARGNAFAATADNPSAIYYNPAGITQLQGHQFRLGVYAIAAETNASLDAGGSVSSNDNWQYAPQFFYTFQPEQSAFTFGLGVYAPFGLQTEYPTNAPFRVAATRGSLRYVSVNPVIAWKVCEGLSVAAGPTFNFGHAALNQAIFPTPNNDEARFRGDGNALGYNIGLLWKPHPKHQFGFTYFSSTSMDFKGYTDTRFSAFSIPFVTPFGVFPVSIPGEDSSTPASTEFTFPQHVVLGWSFRPTDRWNLEVNVDWTDWNDFNTVHVKREGAPSLFRRFNWRSTWFYEFGASYRFCESLTASVGYIYSENSVPNEMFNPIVPDSDRHIFSAGLGQDLGSWSWDIAYQYAYGPSRNISRNTSVDGSYETESHAVSISVGVKF
jgi:long-chain fatty acid transport protein